MQAGRYKCFGLAKDRRRLGGGDEAGNLSEWQSAWLVPLKVNPKKAL